MVQNKAEPSAEEVEAQLQHDIKDDAPREIKDVEPDEESTEIEHQKLQAVSQKFYLIGVIYYAISYIGCPPNGLKFGEHPYDSYVPS